MRKNQLVMSNKIKQILRLKHISITKFAESIGIQKATAAYWIRENCPPPTECLTAIAEYLNVSLDYLFDDSIPASIDEIPVLNKTDNYENNTAVKSQLVHSSLKEADSNNGNTNNADSIEKKIVGCSIPVEFSCHEDVYTKELINIFITLSPKGKHYVLAEAHNQASLQKYESAVKKETR